MFSEATGQEPRPLKDQEDSGASRPRLLLRGLDSLYVSYFVEMRNSRLDFDELAFLQERLKQDRTKDIETATLGSETFGLKPHGRYPYRYILVHEDFEVRLAEHLQPACHVQFFSKGLWLSGAAALVERVERWCGSMEVFGKPHRGTDRNDPLAMSSAIVVNLSAVFARLKL